MGTARQLILLVCAIWISLDQGHSLPSSIDAGPLSTRSLVSMTLTGNFSECGKSKRKYTDLQELSIVNGQKSNLGDWPWMVALFLGSPPDSDPQFTCGASLISDQWLVTAAHCVMDIFSGGVQAVNGIFARLGDLNLDRQVDDGASPIDALFEEIVPHPNASFWPVIINDIALIRLKSPVNFTENIRPICLLSGPKYQTSKYYNGKRAHIVGWGRVKYEGKLPKTMLEISVPVVEQKECSKRYSNRSVILINDRIICAGEPGKGTCDGDSGGPLIFFNKAEKRFYLGGELSGSPNCDTKYYPSRFTKVAQYIGWINEVTGKNY